MTFEEKEKIIYETYKKRYNCDVFVFDTPKFFSNLFSGDEVFFDSIWVRHREIGQANSKVWTVCVSSSGVVFGQLYYFPMHIYDNMENALLVNNLEKFVCFHEDIKNGGFCNLTNDSGISKRKFNDFMSEHMKGRG